MRLRNLEKMPVRGSMTWVVTVGVGVGVVGVGVDPTVVGVDGTTVVTMPLRSWKRRNKPVRPTGAGIGSLLVTLVPGCTFSVSCAGVSNAKKPRTATTTPARIQFFMLRLLALRKKNSLTHQRATGIFAMAKIARC